VLANLGIINDFSVGQRLARVKAHSRVWDATAPRITSSAAAAGFPAMTLTLHLAWDSHAPLWAAGGSSSQAAGSQQQQEQHRALLAAFSPPLGVNSPLPEAVRLLSKPSVQRHVGLRQLLAARRATRPGLFLLSTHEGLLTDIDAELRGIGGTLLAHLALPLGRVVQLRGLLRAKHAAEQAAAAAEQAAAAAQPQQQQQQQQQQLQLRARVQHVPLAAWDARGQVVSTLLRRLADSQPDSLAYLEGLTAAAAAGGSSGGGSHALLRQARQALLQLEMQELAWRQQAGGGGGGGAAAGDAGAPRGRRSAR
jgi:hypothetical protein